jgi:hypothetical protein
MTTQPSPEDRRRIAERLFEEFWLAHETFTESAFDRFVSSHPECSAELRDLRDAKDLGQRGLADHHQSVLDAGKHAQRMLAELRAKDESRYEIGTLIGQGGMGLVHRAFDRKLQRHVAIKTITPVSSPTAQLILLRRFLREAAITSALDHPGIVPFMTSEWIVMERPTTR